MIVWVNGAFGAGKTTTAHELIELIPNSTLFDPEVIGGALERLLPPKRLAEVGDFQDLPISATARHRHGGRRCSPSSAGPS
ncbi:hypothetical protein SALBM217S_06468 [Streptomyces griseoloalbus]